MIPVRVRSNCNWLVVYQLNPIDFENIYKDVVIHDMAKWRSILQFVFGDAARKPEISQTGTEEVKSGNGDDNDDDVTRFIKDKKFENLGIWVEFNIYFKNFKRILI